MRASEVSAESRLSLAESDQKTALDKAERQLSIVKNGAETYRKDAQAEISRLQPYLAQWTSLNEKMTNSEQQLQDLAFRCDKVTMEHQTAKSEDARLGESERLCREEVTLRKTELEAVRYSEQQHRTAEIRCAQAEKDRAGRDEVCKALRETTIRASE